tara:strand:- start:25 stop:978 length:954 start_codon:yes stop_codon:yes gene_type:complete
MILLLGGNGYIGSEFSKQLDQRNKQWWSAPHDEFTLQDAIETHPELVINCAGYTGKPNVDACEKQRDECYSLNVEFPMRMRMLCEVNNIPWLHVSSGCIYKGGKFNGIVADDMRPYYETPMDAQGFVSGFREEDEPNFSFKHKPCSFYSGTKALAEDALKDGNGYICRLRIPFDAESNPRNYLTKLINYPKYYDNVNSLSHKSEFVSACLDLIDKNAPYGIYNVTNPGHVSTQSVVDMVRSFRPDIKKDWTCYEDDDEFYSTAATALRSNCIMVTSKLSALGIDLRPIHVALKDAIENYDKGTAAAPLEDSKVKYKI